MKKRPQLETAKMKLRTYTGELVKVIGTLNVIVKYEKQEVELQTLVVEGCGRSCSKCKLIKATKSLHLED